MMKDERPFGIHHLSFIISPHILLAE